MKSQVRAPRGAASVRWYAGPRARGMLAGIRMPRSAHARETDTAARLGACHDVLTHLYGSEALSIAPIHAVHNTNGG